MLIFWIIIFSVSLYTLIKAADYFTESAEKFGLALKISPFVVGATIISIGTTLPELATAIIATLHGQTEMVAANAIGSNIANILLITGLAAIVAGTLVVRRIRIDLPLLAAATALIVAIIWDRQVTSGEGVVAILGYIVYATYTIKADRQEKSKPEGILPGEDIPVTRESRYHWRKKHRDLNLKLFFVLVVSCILVYLGAEWTVKSIMKISDIMGLASSVVVMSAMAIGTSLPELVVAISAVRKRKYEIALGNVFGANIFNMLMVIGIPALFTTLQVDENTFKLGLPFVMGVTVLYIFSCLTKKIHYWDGMMYLLIYILFLAKLFGLF